MRSIADAKSLALIPRVRRRAVTPRQWIVTRALIVPAVEPVGPAWIAAGPRKVIVELAIADRDLGPGVEVRAPPRDHDHPGVAGAVRDDRCGRLDDRAARRALYDGLRRGRLPLGGVSGHHRSDNEAAERSSNKRTQR